jgi:hypothetical protein
MKIAAAALLLSCAFSCGDFFEPKSQSEFIPTTIDQLNELIISALPEPGGSGLDESYLTGGFLDILTDDVETTAYIDPRDPSRDTWYAQSYVSAIYAMHTWQPNYSAHMQNNGYNMYDKIYKCVYRKMVYVNAPLDYIDKVEGSAEMKNYVRAQALTLRAFYYLQLVNIYGTPYNVNPDGPGIPIRTTAAKENRKTERSTVGEVYALIASDLLTAIDLFENLEPTYQYRIYRASLPMALLLLSRACLYMENWTQAAFYAEKLINEWTRFQPLNLNIVASGASNVHPNAASAAEPDARRTQTFLSFPTYDNSDVIWLYNSASDLAGLTRQDLYQGGSIRLQNNKVYATMTQASKSLVDSYDRRDARLLTYFVRSLFYEPDYDTNPYTGAENKYRAYGKMRMLNSNNGIPDIDNNRFLPHLDSRTFGQALRITEAHLTLAEAKAMLGAPSSEVVGILTPLWNRCFSDGNIPSSYNSGSNPAELVRRERRREFCFEALRWFDLRRWGMPQITHTWHDLTYGTRQTFVLEHNDPGYTLPMPHTMLEANPDLTQVPLAGGGQTRQPRQ